MKNHLVSLVETARLLNQLCGMLARGKMNKFEKESYNYVLAHFKQRINKIKALK